MSRTLKDKPYDHRPKNHKPKHPRLLRDRHFACHYGKKCCGVSPSVYSARAIETRTWKTQENGAY